MHKKWQGQGFGPQFCLITDLKHLNQCHQVQRHRAESWASILDTVGKKNLHLGHYVRSQRFLPPLANELDNAKVDEISIQQLELSDSSICPSDGLSVYGGPTSHQTDKSMDEHSACWWVDDILLLAQTKEEVEKRATMLIHKLTQLGVQVNA